MIRTQSRLVRLWRSCPILSTFERWPGRAGVIGDLPQAS